MKRLQLVRAIALSVGVASLVGSSWSTLALGGDCDTHQNSQCNCNPRGYGLLDRLDEFAGTLAPKHNQRCTILSSFKLSLTHKSKCDQPSCGAEPTCGTEPSCDTEPTCGSEPACGVEPACGAEANCDCKQPVHSHALGPIPYPTHVQPRVEHSAPPRAPGIPQPAPGNLIPAPQAEDATVDPFRDDSVRLDRPQRTRVMPVSSTMQRRSADTPRSGLNYDPQARMPSNGASQAAHATREKAPRAQSTGQLYERRVVNVSIDAASSKSGPMRPAARSTKNPMADSTVEARILASSVQKSMGVKRRLRDEESQESQVPAEYDVVDQSLAQSEDPAVEVVTASAAEPARLPPLRERQLPKSAPDDRDSISSRNPLRDR